MQPQMRAALILVLVSFMCRVTGRKLILVDDENGPHACDSLRNKNVSNYSCNSLQKVLKFVADSENLAGNDSYDYVEIQISKCRNELTEQVSIEQNIILTAKTVELVKITFNGLILDDSFHAILIRSVEHATIEGISFERSRGIIVFENVTRVFISNSSFRYFTNGTVDLFMCFQVAVFNCIFEHNGPVTTLKQEQYRGSAAGISVGYDDNHYHPAGTLPDSVPDGNGFLSITGCTFRNNTHSPLTEDQLDPHQFLSRYLFPGRGGALSLTVNSSFPFHANITDCLVEDNSTQSIGGGFYIAFSGYSEHLTVVSNSEFVRNSARDIGGGGFFVGFVEAGRRKRFSVRLQLYNCNFTENKAVFGGGIFFIAGPVRTSSGELTNDIHMEDCSFTWNTAVEYGAAMCVTSLLYLVPTFNVPPINIINSNFDDNDSLGRGGVLSTAYVPVYFGGIVNFRRNVGRSLAVVGTRVEVHGHLKFYGNGGHGIDGGSVYLTSFAQIEVSMGAQIDFVNNTGILGAALVVDYHVQSTVSKTYLQTIYNPLCPIRYENTTEKPDDWKNVSVTFNGNEALVGSAVFMNGIHVCAWTGQNVVYDLNSSRAFHWNFIEFGINTNIIHYGDMENPSWYVQTPAESITVMENITAFPGEEFNLNVHGSDELGHFTAVVLQLSDANDPTDVSFVPGTGIPEKVHDISVRSRFLSTSGSHSILEKPRQSQISSLLTTNVIQEYFYITPQPCPAGYKLTDGSSGYECICNSEDDPRIASCSGRRILLMGALWGVSVANVNDSSHSLTTHPCPFQYCTRKCLVNGSSCTFIFDEDNPHQQCHCSRHDATNCPKTINVHCVLCGACRGRLGFSVLLNKCVRCSLVNLLWIAGLVLADVLFIGLFLSSKWAPPDWAYPVLYHVQIVPLMTFFFPHTFELIQPYGLYASSALSFYFAYDFCVFPRLSAHYSYLMKFIPLFITIILAIVVAAHRYYYRLHRQPWYGLWWVILLQYTHVVHTAMSVLSCPNLPDSNGDIKPRWTVNGSIECFKRVHLVVALVAMVILTFCVSIIPMVFIYNQGYLQKPVMLQKAFGELSPSFKPRYSWWPAMELFRRLTLVLFIVVFPGNTYPAMFYLAITMTGCTFMQPFKHAVTNILDALLAADVLILLLIQNTSGITFGEESNFLLSEGTVNSSWNCSDLVTEQFVSPKVIALTPFYFIPLALSIFAMVIYSFWLIVEKCQKLETPEDIENLSNPYNAHHGPTTTYLDISGQGSLESSLSHRFKHYMHNTRYLKFGWTRRPPKEHKKCKKKCESLLANPQAHHPRYPDKQPTRNQPKKRCSNAQSSTAFTTLLFRNTNSYKGNGKSNSLPHTPAAKGKEMGAKLSATMTPIRGYVPVTSFKQSNEIKVQKSASQSNEDITEGQLSENNVQHETNF